MKRINYVTRLCLLIAAFSSLLYLTIPRVVSAANVVNDICAQPTGSGETPAVCKDNLSGSGASNPITGPDGIVTKGLQIFVIVLGLTAVVVLMINAVRFITSGGDANSTKTARNGVLYAAIGLVIALSGQLIVSLVISKI